LRGKKKYQPVSGGKFIDPVNMVVTDHESVSDSDGFVAAGFTLMVDETLAI
jgi:hypothetical protein